MLAVLGVVVVALALIGLGFYGLHRIKPGWLRVQAGVWRLITFSLEIGEPGHPAVSERPREQRRELEAGPGNSGPSGSAGQSNEAA